MEISRTIKFICLAKGLHISKKKHEYVQNIKSGDTFLLTQEYTNNFSWIIRVKKSGEEQEIGKIQAEIASILDKYKRENPNIKIFGKAIAITKIFSTPKSCFKKGGGLCLGLKVEMEINGRIEKNILEQCIKDLSKVEVKLPSEQYFVISKNF